jgi:hypothetical protein
MANKHYEKYKETIKKVSKRNYHQRIVSLNLFIKNECCTACGESETVCLKFYPHDKKIRTKIKRVGMNDDSREEILKMIEDSVVVCSNCFIKIENDLIDLNYQSVL